MLSLDSCPRHTQGILARDLGDEYLFYDAANEKVHVLNATARDIYLMCDGRSSVEDVVQSLVERYGIEEVAAREDTEELLTRLVRLGLLRLD